MEMKKIITVSPEKSMVYQQDRIWLDKIEKYGLPADPDTLEHAAEMLIILWRDYKWLENAIGEESK